MLDKARSKATLFSSTPPIPNTIEILCVRSVHNLQSDLWSVRLAMLIFRPLKFRRGTRELDHGKEGQRPPV